MSRVLILLGAILSGCGFGIAVKREVGSKWDLGRISVRLSLWGVLLTFIGWLIGLGA